MNSGSGPLQVGDLLFIAIDNPLYRRVAAATGSWTSHVGVIVDATPHNEAVAESTFPVSKISPLSELKAKSKNGQFSIKRLNRPLTPEEKERIVSESKKRMGIVYHGGFNLDSKRQFCSKFVFEVFKEATGLEIGSVETFRHLLTQSRHTPMWFWHLWYFGLIPWNRRTVTPASQYSCPLLVTVDEYPGNIDKA